MSKFTKLVFHPVKFFEDAAKKKRELAKLAGVSNPVFAFRVNDWKRPTLEAWLAGKTLIYVPFKASETELEKKWLPLINNTAGAEILAWGMTLPAVIASAKKPVRFVEDGFIRSIELGSKHAPPLSLNFDSKSPYFDSSKATDLENILASYEFSQDGELMLRAEKLIKKIVRHGISKYNSAKRTDVKKLVKIDAKKKTVLVVGQVEDDASILFGCNKKYSNNDVVRIAAKENPDSQILYKPHPDVLHDKRKLLSNPSEVSSICTIIKDDVAVHDVLSVTNHVYTITSQVGFEALLRGLKVTTLGCPFYAGWGLTDTRQQNTRRTRLLTVEELFAGSCILYPEYFSPITKERSTPEEVVDYIIEMLTVANEKAPKPKAKPPQSTNKRVAPPSVRPEAKKKSAEKQGEVPEWYIKSSSNTLRKAAGSKAKTYLYVPWVEEHTDTLIKNIRTKSYQLLPFDFVKNIDVNRRDVGRFARAFPVLYRKMALRRLVELKPHVTGIILTFDWFPAMRLIAEAAKDIGIPVILIPHESVFADRNSYYFDTVAKGSYPVADCVLGWGELQRSIFEERGYDTENKFLAVGAPKFDKYANYQPALDRQQFFNVFGLSSCIPTILFAAQPLDSQFDTSVALSAQREAISDLIDVCEALALQLIIRLPPAQHTILNASLIRRINSASFIAVDDAGYFLVKPEEAIFHSSIIASVNSTMLFEALLADRMPISTKYVEFEQLWDNCNIPVAKSKEHIFSLVSSYLAGEYEPDPNGLIWAAQMFSPSGFDGKAAERISLELEKFSSEGFTSSTSKFDTLLEGNADVVAIPSNPNVLATVQKHLKDTLRVNTLVSSSQALLNAPKLVSVDCFLQWGITDSNNKKYQRKLASQLGKPVYIIEDGFIRSLQIGLSGEPGLSVILDDLTSYYDATRASRLETLLETGPDLTTNELNRSRLLISKIVENKISKYNHAPELPVQIGNNKDKILLLDQRSGDQSVLSGLGDDQTFAKMLSDAISQNPDSDIIIKQHPDAIGGGKGSYFNNDAIAYTKFMPNVYVVDFDINPYSLLDIVSTVYVVTSGMGFEALLAGKNVHCYGLPFYSGWGLTCDHQISARRSRKRSLEAVFYFSYIYLSRYYSPRLSKPCALEELIEDFVYAKERGGGDDAK